MVCMHGTGTHGHGTHDRDTHEALHAHAEADSVETALAALRERGKRITVPRTLVIGVLAQGHDHLTAEQVAVELPSVHRATVYRTLDRLAELGIVTAMRQTDATAYHLAVAPNGHEHLHARCRSCRQVIVLPVDALDSAVRALRSSDLFELEPEHSDLVGLCPNCAAPRAARA
jgi:Fe2+ or Zn2+ uptake regulation protein